MSGGLPPQPRSEGRAVAAFDFDGTLTNRDSFTAFLRWRTSLAGWLVGLARLSPALIRYLFDRDRGRLKAASVTVFLSGLPQDRLKAEAERFAAQEAERLFRPDALAVWRAHTAAGDLRVIVTASPEEVVRPFADRLGADALIGSRLRWTQNAQVGDGLSGENCRGQAKVDRLRALFGPDLKVSDAYGDTSGDREMLAMAERGHFRRFTGRP